MTPREKKNIKIIKLETRAAKLLLLVRLMSNIIIWDLKANYDKLTVFSDFISISPQNERNCYWHCASKYAIKKKIKNKK